MPSGSAALTLRFPEPGCCLHCLPVPLPAWRSHTVSLLSRQRALGEVTEELTKQHSADKEVAICIDREEHAPSGEACEAALHLPS